MAYKMCDESGDEAAAAVITSGYEDHFVDATEDILLAEPPAMSPKSIPTGSGDTARPGTGAGNGNNEENDIVLPVEYDQEDKAGSLNQIENLPWDAENVVK